MRVSTKMTLGLSTTCLVIMGLHGFNQLRNEDRDLRTAVERDIRLLGDTSRLAVETSLRDRQMQDIQEMLDSTDKIDPSVDILFFDEGSRLRATSPGSATDKTLETMAAETAASGRSELRFETAGEPGR